MVPPRVVPLSDPNSTARTNRAIELCKAQLERHLVLKSLLFAASSASTDSRVTQKLANLVSEFWSASAIMAGDRTFS